MDIQRTASQPLSPEGLLIDDLDYKVALHRELVTQDGRRFKEIELKPVTMRDYTMVMDVENPLRQAQKIIANQLQLKEEDLWGLDNRDMNRLIAVVAHFLPFGLL